MAAIASNGTGGGNWSAGASWTGGVVPAEGDTVTIANGDTITWDAGAANPLIVGADTTTAAIAVAAGGTLQMLSSIAAGTYTLRLKGDFTNAGTVNFGTVANPLASDRILIVELNYSASLSIGEFGWKNNAGCTFIVQGASKTTKALLASDITHRPAEEWWQFSEYSEIGAKVRATTDTGCWFELTALLGEGPWITGETEPVWDTTVGNTTDDGTVQWTAIARPLTMTVDSAPSWADDEKIALSASLTDITQHETFTLNGASSGMTVNIDGTGMLYDHIGTSPRQCEVINLNRNIRFTSYNTAYQGYIVGSTTATEDVDYVQFDNIGSNATDKTGIALKTTTGTANYQYCAFWNVYRPFNQSGNANSNSITVSNNVAYNITDRFMLFPTSPNANPFTISANTIIAASQTGSVAVLQCNDDDSTVTNNIVTSSYAGYSFGAGSSFLTGTYTGNSAHSCTNGLNITLYLTGGTIENGSFYHCAIGGVIGSTTGSPGIYGLILKGISFFGNVANVSLTNAHDILLDTLTVNSTAEQSSIGVALHYAVTGLKMQSCDSTASGIKTACSVDFAYSNESGVPYFGGVMAYNCKFGAMGTNPVSGSGGNPSSYLYSARHNQTDGDHRAYLKYGTVFSNGETIRATPNSATNKLVIPVVAKKVADGSTITFSVDVTKSAAYSGNQPRLIIKRDDAMGISTDTILDTMTAAVTVLETLTGTTAAALDDGAITAYVDCDGTAGYIDIDNGVAT